MRFRSLAAAVVISVCCGCGSNSAEPNKPADPATSATAQTTPAPAQNAAKPKAEKGFAFLTPASADWTSEIRQDPVTVSIGDEEIDAPKLVTTIQGPSHGFTVAEFTGPANHLVVAVKQTSITKVWDFFKGAEVAALKPDPTAMVFEGMVNSSDTFVALGMNNKTVELWELATNTRKAILKGFQQNVVEDLAFSSDGNLLATAASSEPVKIWDVNQVKQISSLPNKNNLSAMVFNHDATALAGVVFRGSVFIWDTKTGEVLQNFSTESEFLYCATYIGDTPLLVTGDGQGQLRIIDTKALEEVGLIQAHKDTVYSMAVSADGRMMATGGKDKLVKLWRTEDFELLAELQGHPESVVSVALSGDGRFLAARGGSEDHVIQVWQLPRRRLQSKLDEASQ